MKDLTLNIPFSIYLLYPVDRDNEDDFYKQLQNYINVGTEIFAYLIDWEKMDGLPKCRLYVPADHEVFIHNAYKSGFITKDNIECINCNIIENCDLVILYGHTVQNSKEIECARLEEIPIYSMPDLSPMAIEALKLSIKIIVKAGD